jgi:hypothetical protein
LFGLLTLATLPSELSYFSLFAGLATISAVMPDLASVAVVLLLRLACQTAWPPAAEATGTVIAMAGLLACAVLLAGPDRRHRTSLLLLGQTSIAALVICTGQAEGRFAALVLLVLLILTRSAARSAGGAAATQGIATLAIAGLGCVSPLGVFPGLVLVMLTISGHDPWLLLPFGVALIPMTLASLPGRLPDFSLRRTMSSVGWVPLLLALLAGYFAPDGLVHWWRVLAAGRT